MEEPESSDSSADEQSKRIHQHPIAAQDDSDLSPYSDSETEESSRQKSMYSVYKTGHIPGKYKTNLQESSSTENVTMDGSEQSKEISGEKTDTHISDSIAVQIDKDCNDEIKDFALTGIFEKSMMVIPSMQFNENVIADTVSVEIQKPSPESIPPKPAPRKSKRVSKEIYYDKQVINEISEGKERPLPSPRTKKKTEEEISLKQQLEHPKFTKDSMENLSVLKTNSEGDLVEETEDKDENIDEEVDTVDIGSAQDCTCKETSIKFEHNSSSCEKNLKQVEKEEKKDTLGPDKGEDIQHKSSTASSSFEIVDDLENFVKMVEKIDKTVLREEEDSDVENAENFVNDFQDSDSGKGAASAESEPEGEFETPENQSLEKENDIFYDSTPIQADIESLSGRDDKILEKTDKTDETQNDIETSHNEEGSKEETMSVQMKIKSFEESVVVIGKGTIREQYESISSTVLSDDFEKLESSNEGNVTNINEKKFGSILSRICMFEQKFEEKKDSDSSGRVKTNKSCSSNSSFDVLSTAESEDSELKSDIIDTSPEQVVLEENHNELKELGVDSNISKDDNFVDKREDFFENNMPSPTAEKIESMGSMLRDAKVDESPDYIVQDENNVSDVIKEDIESINSHQDKLVVNTEDSPENDMPPPIAEKSEAVLESMKSMYMDAPDIPPRSLPQEQEMDSFVKIDTGTQENVWIGESSDSSARFGITDGATNTDGVNSDVSEQEQDDPYQQQNDTPFYPNMQYNPQFPQYQQQQQYQSNSTQGWNQPYYYSQQYQYPFYNPKMNPGMVYQNQNTPYFQQPYFTQQYGMQYGYMQPEGDPFRSNSPANSTTSSCDETGHQIQVENLTPDNDDDMRKPPPQHVHHKEVKHKTGTNSETSDGEYSKISLTKSKSDDTIRKASSPAVKRSVSMPKASLPVRKASASKKNAEKGRQTHAAGKEPLETLKEEDYYIYFRNLNPVTKPDVLGLFVENYTGGLVDSNEIIFNYPRTCALVTVSLNQKLDLCKMKEKIKSKGLDSHRPEVFEVLKPTKIAVSSETQIRNTENLDLYFESRKAQGNVELAELKGDTFETDDGSCFVLDFGDPDVVKRICAREKHEVDGHPLRVSPYYECEGGAIWNSRIHVLKIPDPVDLQYKPNYLCILQRSCCATLIDDLKKNNCVPEFKDDKLQLQCTLTPEMTGFKGLAENWEKKSKDIVATYISENIIQRKLRSSQQVWPDLIEFYNSENMQACEEVVASLKSDKYKISLIGFSGSVQDKLTKLERKQTEIEKWLSRRTETIENLDNLKLKLLQKVRVFEELESQLEDIKIAVGDGKLTIEGQPEDISEVHVKWYDIDNKISKSQWNHGFSRECVHFVNNVLTEKIDYMLEGDNITAVWMMNDKGFTLYAFENGENVYETFDEDEISSRVCTKAENLLKSAVVEMKEPVEDSITEVLSSPEWFAFMENITETFETAAELEPKNSEILIHGMRKEAHDIHSSMKDFLDKNAIKSETVKTRTENIWFIREHREDFVQRLEKRLEQDKVKIDLRDDCVRIRGNKRGIGEARKELNIFLDAIIFQKHTIQKVAVKDVFKDENEHGTIKKIEKETSCLIKIPGENIDFIEQADIDDEFEEIDGYMIPNFTRGATGSSQGGFGGLASESSSMREKGFKAPNGVKVNLVKGELGKQDGNVIVVTTSPNLNLNSGNACKSVLREGGPQLQSECKEKYPNEIKFGEIAVVNAHGTLECNKVYLTSLPNWNSEHDPQQILEKIMKDSLELAEKHKKYSIVFCAMGTGQLKYPTDLVAKVMYQAVVNFDHSHPQSALKEVKFVLYEKDFATIKAFEEEESFRQSGDGERPTFELKTGKITIELLVENIAQQRVDAILCSTSPNMELSRSGACQALVRVGGKTLQEECKKKYDNKLEEGNVVEIGGGNLPCKSVFLTVLPRFSPDSSVNVIKKVMQTFLNLANAKGYKSLAMPALGTGFLHYPTDKVCQCMFQTVIEWAKSNPASSVTTIKFIMYAKDHNVIQRFKSYIQQERGRGKRENRRTLADPKHQGALPKKPILIPKKQQKALFNAHPDGVQIGKIKLSVFKGDILSHQIDAIVSSVDKDFEFIGAVAQGLKSRCPEMEQECQQKENITKLNQDGVLITKGGNQLPAKNVIHVKYTEHIGGWKERMHKCIETANKKHLKTIAFPVLGTGNAYTTFNPDEIAGCLFDAVFDFIQKTKSPSIKEIHLIVYKGQPATYPPIMDKLHKKIQEAATTSSDGFLAKGAKAATKMMNKLKQNVFGKEGGTMSEQGSISEKDKKKIKQEISSLEVIIYSDSKSNIEKCKKELEAILEKSYDKKKIEEYKELIKTLEKFEEEQLDIAALADIKIDKQAGIITVNGPHKHVSYVIHELRMRLLKIERHRHLVVTAEELYKLVHWQYEEVTDTGFEYIVYDKMLNQKIEEAYKANATTYEFEENDGETFVIDFKKLIEYNKTDTENTVRVVRKDILKAIASALPEDWADMKDNENIKVVSVPSTDKEYQDIEKNFISQVKTGSYSHRLNFDPNNLKITKIERIQNKTLYRQYQAKKNQMKELKPNLPANMPIERDLWHGTKYDAVTSIQLHGFNRSYSGNANGEPWYGEGVYFAANASYSARGWLSGAGAGSKGYMFVVKTLTGELCKGNKGMRYLPAVDQNKPTILYDCAVDNLQNPMEFVIFNDTQAYPAYIITFTT